MNLAHVLPIADAILYEGYLLYPYRASALKNQRRWTFGVLSPQAYSEARGGLEPSSLQSQCLVTGGPDAEVEVALRFLHPVSRTAEGLAGGLAEDGQEAWPVQIDSPPVRLADLERDGLRRLIACGPRRDLEVVRDPAGVEAAAVVRIQERLQAALEVRAERCAGETCRLTVRVSNLTPPGDQPWTREAAARQSLVSTHLVLGVRGGAFVSLLDPPAELRPHAEACRSRGAWPVLAGRPGQRDTLLCSPIILEDHPQVAPESPGDLFDGTEIDEILTLRILTLTDEERRQMAAGDERVRAVLERTRALEPDRLARLHGAVLGRRGDTPPRSLVVAGTALGPGDRVRLLPAPRGDVFDLALAGRAATIVSVEQDYEDRAYFTVTVDDDPGRDLGAEGKPGHRFFFGPDEVEPLR